MLIASDFRLAPERDVVRRRQAGPQHGLLLGLKVLAGEPLRAAVATTAVLLAAPARGVGARVVERCQQLAGEAVVTDRRHRPLDAAFVARPPPTRRINVKPTRLRVLEKRRGDAR